MSKTSVTISPERWEILCGILDLAPSATLGSVEGELIRMTERYDELRDENKKLRAALDGFVNYQAEGHFDEVLEHDEQLKSEARAALAAHQQAKGE